MRAVHAMAQFEYSLRDDVDLEVTGLTHIERSSGVGGSVFSIDGELRLHQCNLLKEKEVRPAYTERALVPGRPGGAQRADATLPFGSVISANFARNETTSLTNSQAVWVKGGVTSSSLFRCGCPLQRPWWSALGE